MGGRGPRGQTAARMAGSSTLAVIYARVMEAELNPGLADGEACVPAMYKDARGSGAENGIELETSCMSTV